MATSTEVLTLAQWLSPAYPVGAFAYSHGLEALAQSGAVASGDDLRAWLVDVLCHGAGRTDAVFLAAAYHAEDHAAVVRINQRARAFAPGRARLLETEQMGRAFAAITGDVWQAELRGLCYPVALGAAAAREMLPLDLTLEMYLHAFLANLVSAAQRLLPLGQTEAQTLVRALTPLCQTIATDSRAGNLDGLTASAFLGDIAAMHHETLQHRIFRT